MGSPGRAAALCAREAGRRGGSSACTPPWPRAGRAPVQAGRPGRMALRPPATCAPSAAAARRAQPRRARERSRSSAPPAVPGGSAEPGRSPPSCRFPGPQQEARRQASCPCGATGPAWNRLPRGCGLLTARPGTSPTLSSLRHLTPREKVCSPKGEGPEEGASLMGRLPAQMDNSGRSDFASGTQPQASWQTLGMSSRLGARPSARHGLQT